MHSSKKSIIQSAFFILPFCLLGARALQSGGIYLFAILIPLFSLRKQGANAALPTLSLGCLLISIWALFPLNDLLHGIFRREIGFSYLHRSQISSTVLVSGIFLVIIAWIDHRKSSKVCGDSLHLDEAFNRGMLFATLILGSYLILQYLSGYDIFPEYAYRQDRRFVTGAYRVTGLTSHPITMAGISLAIFAYYWTLAWRRSRIDLFCIALCHLVFIFMTGCRMPVLIAAILAGSIPFHPGSRFSLRARILTVSALVIFGSLLMLFSGIVERFLEFISLWKSDGRIDAREVFWNVHWRMFLDSPWIGQGYHWLEESIRHSYYVSMGYENFPRKYNAHNIFLETLANLGLIGSISLSLISVMLGLACRKFVTKHGSAKLNDIYVCLGFAFFANLLHGLSENSFYDAPIIYIYIGLYWLFFWMAYLQNPNQHADSVHSFSEQKTSSFRT